MTSLYKTAIALFAALLLISVLGAKSDRLRIHVDEFGRTKEGDLIHRYTLRNKTGVEATIVNYGAKLVTLKVPDRDGHLSDVVLGYDDLKSYEEGKSYFGASIGRYAKRIAKGEFSLNGKTYTLARNDGPNSVHGGTRGFNKRVWTGSDHSTADAQVLALAYTSADGEFDRWLRKSPEHLSSYVEIAAIWIEGPTLDPESKWSIDTLIEHACDLGDEKFVPLLGGSVATATDSRRESLRTETASASAKIRGRGPQVVKLGSETGPGSPWRPR